MRKDFDPSAAEWLLDTTELGNALARQVILEIEIDTEILAHDNRVEAIVDQFQKGKLTVDEYLNDLEKVADATRVFIEARQKEHEQTRRSPDT